LGLAINLAQQKRPLVVLWRLVRSEQRHCSEALPEPAAQGEAQVSRLHRRSPVACGLRPCLETQRQQCLYACADGLAKDRGGTICRDADDEGRAVDDGPELEIAERRTVDDIDRHTVMPGSSHKGAGLCLITGFRDGESSIPEIARCPAPRIDRQCTEARISFFQIMQPFEAASLVRCKHVKLCTRRKQQLCLPQRALAVAREHNLAGYKFVEQRQCGQWRNAWRFGRSGLAWRQQAHGRPHCLTGADASRVCGELYCCSPIRWGG
jgi:hypothetical protein